MTMKGSVNDDQGEWKWRYKVNRNDDQGERKWRSGWIEPTWSYRWAKPAHRGSVVSNRNTENNRVDKERLGHLAALRHYNWLMIAYIALFSALLSRLIALICGSAWVTSFYSAFFCCWISTEVVYLQRWHGWCHMKLQPSRRKSCVHHTTMLHVTSCKATYVRCMRV